MKSPTATDTSTPGTPAQSGTPAGIDVKTRRLSNEISQPKIIPAIPPHAGQRRWFDQKLNQDIGAARANRL